MFASILKNNYKRKKNTQRISKYVRKPDEYKRKSIEPSDPVGKKRSGMGL